MAAGYKNYKTNYWITYKQAKDMGGIVKKGEKSTAICYLFLELFSSYLCGFVGIDKIVIENSAAYLNFWLSQLKEDSKIFVHASQQLNKAIKYFFTFIKKKRTASEYPIF